jgi:hypothetical protein
MLLIVDAIIALDRGVEGSDFLKDRKFELGALRKGGFVNR